MTAILSLGRAVALLPLIFLLLPACNTVPAAHGESVWMDPASGTWQSGDGSVFPFKCWLPDGAKPHAVVIGVHGLSGAVRDHAELAAALSRRGMAFYGYELRGQGNDPVKERIGDIRSARDWQNDLWAFHRLVQARHPGVPVVWFGESLGALIACGAVAMAPEQQVPPQAMVLASPIPAFDERVALWHRQLIGIGALLDPTRRIPLQDWATPSGTTWQMTERSEHFAQLANTPWAVSSYTVRFYHTLSLMVGRMMCQAQRINEPVLILHAAHDVFAGEASVEAFARRLPDAELKVYGESHHLLFYDKEKDQVVSDMVRWVGSEPWAKTAMRNPKPGGENQSVPSPRLELARDSKRPQHGPAGASVTR